MPARHLLLAASAVSLGLRARAAVKRHDRAAHRRFEPSTHHSLKLAADARR